MKHLIWFCSCGRNSHYHDPLIVSLRPTWDSQRTECSEFPVGYWDLRRADKSGWAHSCIEPLDRFSQKRIMEDDAGYYSDHNDSNLLFCIGNSFYVKAFKYFRGRKRVCILWVLPQCPLTARTDQDEARAVNSVQFSHMTDRDPATSCISRKLESAVELGVERRKSGTECRCSKWFLNHSARLMVLGDF